MIKSYFENYFFLNLNEYSNIGANLYVNLLLFAVFLGLCLGVLVLFRQRCAVLILIKQIIRHEAKNEQSAKTLGELGLAENRGVRRALSSGGMLTQIVSRTGQKKYTYEEYATLSKEEKRRGGEIDFSTATFFISAENEPRAKRVYESYDNSPIKAGLVCVLLMIIFVCISLAMPTLLSFLNGIMA